jgi:hypothetical protein
VQKFNKKIQQLLEDMTTTSTLGPTQGHPANVGQSGDFYAPGDARNVFGSLTKKKKKKGKKIKEVTMIRRTFPGM